MDASVSSSVVAVDVAARGVGVGLDAAAAVVEAVVPFLEAN